MLQDLTFPFLFYSFYIHNVLTSRQTNTALQAGNVAIYTVQFTTRPMQQNFSIISLIHSNFSFLLQRVDAALRAVYILLTLWSKLEINTNELPFVLSCDMALRSSQDQSKVSFLSFNVYKTRYYVIYRQQINIYYISRLSEKFFRFQIKQS